MVANMVAGSATLEALTAGWHPEFINRRPVLVTLAGRTYDAVRFDVVSDSPRYGRTVEPGLYVVGTMPRIVHSTETRTGTTFTLPGDDGDWYIAGHCPDADPAGAFGTHDAELHARYCPAGASFQMRRWPHETFGTRIDAYGRVRGAKRLPVTLG